MQPEKSAEEAVSSRWKMRKSEEEQEMEQKDTRFCEPQEKIWEKFTGKRMVLGGTDGREYQAFFQNLVSISRQSGAGFRVVDGIENAVDGDYVILFVRPTGREELKGSQLEKTGIRQPSKRAKSWDVPFEEPDLHHTWEKAPGAWKTAEADWTETLRVLRQLRQLSAVKPQAVLLVSGNEVYGKCFGVQHPLREEELGYVCHTDSDDVPAQCMRTAEYFAGQLAAERSLPVRIARMGTLPAGEALLPLLISCAKVLLYGDAAEIYNLPDGSEMAERDAQQGRTERTERDVRQGRTAAVEIHDLSGGSERAERDLSGAGTEAAEDEQNRAALPEAGRLRKTILFGRKGADGPQESRMQENGKIVRFPVKDGGTSSGANRREEERSVKKEEHLETEGFAYESWRALGGGQEEGSPLAPVKVITDTRKADRLGK